MESSNIASMLRRKSVGLIITYMGSENLAAFPGAGETPESAQGRKLDINRVSYFK